MAVKITLRVFKFFSDRQMPEFLKTIELPAYLFRMDDLAMLVARSCGCHNYHIEYESGDGVVRRLCDIQLKRRGRRDVEYRIPLHEDLIRVSMVLERNKKKRHMMKETTKTGRT